MRSVERMTDREWRNAENVSVWAKRKQSKKQKRWCWGRSVGRIPKGRLLNDAVVWVGVLDARQYVQAHLERREERESRWIWKNARDPLRELTVSADEVSHERKGPSREHRGWPRELRRNQIHWILRLTKDNWSERLRAPKVSSELGYWTRQDKQCTERQ
jgi:hypothetical protein